ncbi:NusA N-terminal domain-containing protein [endosymbiont of Pachyrhynchus infernalis]|uniref:NusA N-terminal domain-containing protein n=1 Tax=endosymbiont of Pachyrhynchus infernalis TaxID=1971488 RepID=UPI000DC6F884|nr:NusA N-terminal domain-containing protein [endosymbiont of Pachyrhynchus infernalis]BBA84953.1 transcription termination/antitermination protein NusA [endosymbiont of Pachyrhynchus infernalis]
MKDILNIVEYLSNDKLIKKDKIFDIIESIIKFSIKKKFKDDFNNIKIIFDRKIGSLKIFKIIKNNNITNEKKTYINKLNTDFFLEEIKDIEYNRTIIQYAKNFIFKKINNLEKLELFNKYKNSMNKVFLCIVKKIYNNKILLLIDNNIEGIIFNKNLLYNDNFKVNDKFKGILYFIKSTKYNIQLFISRIGSTIIRELLNNEIFELNNNTITIVSISREPGIKTKIAVKSNNRNINPIHFLVINKKYVLKLISNEFNKESIDIILWNSNLLEFIKNSIYPINIKSIYFNKKNNNINILINKNDILKVIGKNGINIKLISSLVNHSINISYNKN